MRAQSLILATLSSLSHATFPNPTWIIPRIQNLTSTLQLSQPIPAQTSNEQQAIFIIPSDQNRSSFVAIPDDIWPSLPYPGFWTCPRDTPLPPNTEDCLQVINNTYGAYWNITVDVPADRCIQASYRSCLMYTCSSTCGGFPWNVGEWHRIAMHLQNSCVWGRGGGGYVQRQPGGRDEAFVYRTGLTHISAAGNLLASPIVC